MLRICKWAWACGIVLMLACDTPEQSNEALAPAGSDLNDQAAIIDGSINVQPFFRFIATSVRQLPELPGTNDNALYPTLEICELNGNTCGPVLWQFTRPGRGSSRDKLEVDKLWTTKWHPSALSLKTDKNYRVRVRLDSYELGSVDVDIVENASHLASINRKKHIGLVKGSGLNLAFYVESGVFTYVKNSGESVVADRSNFTLHVPKGAVKDVHLGVLAGRTPPAGATLVAGTYYEVVPADVTFSKPARLMIKYNASDIPQGIAESSLKVLQYQNGSWSEVAGSVIDVRKHMATADVSGTGNYAVGVLVTAAPVVSVTLQTPTPSLGSPISAVQRISSGAARTSCVNNLRNEAGTLANEYWRGPNAVAIVNGECPFQGYITRAGTYRFEAIVDGVAGQSEPFTVGASQGASLTFGGIPAGPYYAGSTLSSDNIVVSLADATGNPLSNVDVDVQLTYAGFNFGGAATDRYAQSSDASGRIQLPPGTWTLRDAPGVNTMRAQLPNSSVAATHEITTNSGAPARLFANPVIGTVEFGHPLSITVFVQDANGVAVSINDLPVTATLSNGSSTTELGSVNSVNGEASFTFNFTQFGPNHTITFATTGVASHATNAFAIMGSPPAVPGELRLTAVGNNSLSVEVQNVTFTGSNPIFQIRYMESPGGSFASMDIPATSGEFIPVTLTALSAGTQYEINARACDGHGCSAWTSNLSVPTLQPAPQNLRTASIGTTFTMIAWDAQTFTNGAPHGFEVWLRQGTGAFQFHSNASTTGASFTGLAPNTQYTAEVRACNASGCTPSQLTFTTLPLPLPPAAPSRLQFNSQSAMAITIGWVDNSSNETGFYILKRTSPQTSFVRIATVGAGVNSYGDTDIIQGQTVAYQVQAFNEGGTTSSNTTGTIVPAGQTQAIAPWDAPLMQQGTTGQASTWPPRVRVVNMSNGTGLFGVPVTFAITSGTGTFAGGATSVVVNTNSTGIATSPNWILGSGSNTVTAITTHGTVVFNAQGN